MKTLILATMTSFFFVSTVLADSSHFEHLPLGGRKALHGMVLFGSGPYFLEHIPMLSPPHDFQIVVVATLKDSAGSLLQRDFSQEVYTLKPSSSFSLNDYVAGRLKSFSASIHHGSFEQGGEVVAGLNEVVVEITSYKVRRQLPALSEMQWFQFSDGKNTFESNVIRPGQNKQLIRNLGTGQILWCVEGPDFFNPCR